MEAARHPAHAHQQPHHCKVSGFRYKKKFFVHRSMLRTIAWAASSLITCNMARSAGIASSSAGSWASQIPSKILLCRFQARYYCASWCFTTGPDV
eukprot:358645-Chlamydomonas_euryale.AAC.7